MPGMLPTVQAFGKVGRETPHVSRIRSGSGENDSGLKAEKWRRSGGFRSPHFLPQPEVEACNAQRAFPLGDQGKFVAKIFALPLSIPTIHSPSLFLDSFAVRIP